MTDTATTGSSFAETLSAAIRDRGVTLAHLGERLSARGNPVSRATLSYWRSGSRRPEGVQSLAAIADLEELLGLDRGALLDRLGPTQRTGPLGTTAFPFDEESLEGWVRETFVAMGASYPDPTRELTIHSVTDVGADRRVRRRTTRLIVQATSGVVTAIPFVEITGGIPTPPPRFEAVGGGRISTTYSHESGQVHGFLFEPDQAITTPETTMIEWSVEFPPEFPATDRTGHGVAFQSRELVLWMRFDPDAVPDWIEEVAETPSGREVNPRSLGAGRTLHAVRRGFGPGGLSMRWGWGEHPADD